MVLIDGKKARYSLIPNTRCIRRVYDKYVTTLESSRSVPPSQQALQNCFSARRRACSRSVAASSVTSSSSSSGLTTAEEEEERTLVAAAAAAAVVREVVVLAEDEEAVAGSPSFAAVRAAVSEALVRSERVLQ